VIRNAGALDNAARTMLTEVQVDNSDGSLLPGMYAQVKFTLPQQRTSLIVPTSSLVVDRSGMHVVTVDGRHSVHFIPVTIGKDMGKEVEILNGLHGAEPLVSSPSDLLNEGEQVEVR
jgi:multidrug efflux pump subunit AcrA (membrane-fusion protein)